LKEENTVCTQLNDRRQKWSALLLKEWGIKLIDWLGEYKCTMVLPVSVVEE
jgi:hypothetical protein